MPNAATSIAATPAAYWKNPESLGFSTWKRNMSVSLAGGGGQLQQYGYDRAYNQKGDQGGLRNIYDRHASFSSNLIARRYRRADSSADAERFTYASSINKRQRYSYHTLQSVPSLLQRKQNPGFTGVPAGNGMSDGAAGNRSMDIRSPVAAGQSSSLESSLDLPGGNAPNGIASGRIELGSTRAVADSLESGKELIGSFSSSSFQRKGDPGLVAGHITRAFTSPLTTKSLINRSPIGRVEPIARKPGMGESSFPSVTPHVLRVKPRSFSHANIGPEGNLFRAYKRTDVIPPRNIEPGSAPDLGVPHRRGDLSMELVQRRTGYSQIQPLGRQISPIIRSVSESANSMARPVASILGHNAGAGAMLPSFVQRRGQKPDAFSLVNRIHRKETLHDAPRIERGLQISSSGRSVPSAATSNPAMPRFNESFSQPRYHHIHSPSIAHPVLRRITAASSPKASGLSGVPAMEFEASSLPASHGGLRNSITITSSAHSGHPNQSVHSTGRPISTSSFSNRTPDHFVLQRSMAASLPAAVEGIQNVAIQALPEPMQPVRPPGTPHDQAQGHEGYEDALPAIQRLQGRTGPLPAYRRVMAHPESAHLPHRGHIGQLLHLPGPVMQNKPVSSLAAGAGSYDRSGSGMEWSRLSLQIVRGRSLPSHILRRSSEAHPGVPAVRDPIAVTSDPHIFHRLRRLPDHSVSSAFTIEPTNHSQPAIADRGFSVKTGGTSPNVFSPGFFFVSRQAGITETAVMRSGVSGQDRVSADSHLRGMTSINVARITGHHPQPRSLPISPRRPSATAFFPSPLSGSGEGAGVSLSNPMAPPRSFHSAVMRAIRRSTEQSQMSLGSKKNSLVPEARARGHQGFDLGELQYNWKPGSEGRPFPVLQRTHDKLMRVSSQESIAPEAPPRPEDRYGLVSPPSETRGEHAARSGDANNLSRPGIGKSEPEEIAEHAWRIMAERLVIEQERRGLAKWP